MPLLLASLRWSSLLDSMDVAQPVDVARVVPSSFQRTRHQPLRWRSLCGYARCRGTLVTTDGELRRPTSSRCTDGDVTTAPVPRVSKSPFRLAASRPIQACRTPGEKSATAAATCPALRPPTTLFGLAHGQAQHEQPLPVPEPAVAYARSRTAQRPLWPAVTFPRQRDLPRDHSPFRGGV